MAEIKEPILWDVQKTELRVNELSEGDTIEVLDESGLAPSTHKGEITDIDNPFWAIILAEVWTISPAGQEPMAKQLINKVSILSILK